MTWGNSGLLSTNHLTAAINDPSQARAEIQAAVEQLIATINGRAAVNGVAPLDNQSKIPNNYLPNTIVSDTTLNLILQPSTGVVAIDYLLNLSPRSLAQLEALTPVPNMVALCSDGDVGLPCLAVYTGENDIDTGVAIWRRISLGARISLV